MQAQPASRKPNESRVTGATRQAMRFAATLLAFALAWVTAPAAAAPNYRLENGQVLIGASVPGISPARTDYAVGSTPGTLSIDRGAAAYSIPIPVPPGVAGMQPSIGLQYSSQGGNGTVGAGFSLTGLSQIARCARTQTQDGARGIVAYDANDRFCLDGQRLIAISGSDGANGTEYRTEIDGFSRVISYGTTGKGPTWFKVWTKGGQVIEYGTDESAIQPAGRKEIAVWSVKRISDTVGNQLTFSYFKQSDRSESYPTRIDYPGGKVDLIYESRPDPTQSYSQGGLYRLTKRLARIETWSGTLKLNEFRLGYQTDGVAPVSRLTTVLQCDGQGACLPPTVFTWEGGDIAFPGIQSNGLAGLCRNGSTDLGVCNDADNFDSLQYPDINGDGITDVCYRGDQGIQCFIGDGAGGWGTRISTGICANGGTTYGVCNDSDNFDTIRFIDLNGDGRSDLFYRGDLGIQVHLSNGTGFQAAFSSPLCANASPHYGGCNDSANYLSLQFAEINGDGDPDLCYRADSGIQCYLGNGQGGFSTQIATDICANGSNNYGVCNGADNWNSIRYLDLNGDGLSDLLYRGDQGIQVHFSTGSGFRLASSSPICANGSTGHGVCNDSDNHTLIYNPDINADGVPDLCYRGDSGIHCHVADGAGQWIQERATDICANRSTKYGVCNDSDNYATIRFADLNNDGYTDLTYRADAGIRVHLNTGTGFVDALATPLCRNGACFNLNSIALADINADAQADLLMLESDGLKVWMQQDFSPRLVTRITDSLGASTQIAYKPLTDASVYDPAVTLDQREIAIRGPLRAVAATQTSDGLGGINRTSYRYGGVKANRDGRGLLGFAWEQVTDEATGRTSTTEYRQDFPFVGTPWRTSSYLANGDLISESTVTLASLTTVGGAVMPYAAETVAKSWEPGGRLLSTVVTRQADHDAYGNVGTVEISTTAGGETFRKVTASTYRNLIDTNRWFLGRLTRAQVTHIDASGKRSVKTSAFSYFEATHGLLQQEIIEPDSTAPGIRQATTYEYDRFGNITRTTVSGTDSAGRAIARSSQSAYTADGRFVQTATNALGHSERHTYDARCGELVVLTGPNGQTTRWDFDGFGRKTAEWRADGTATLLERGWVGTDDPAAPPHAVYQLSQQDTAAAAGGRLPPVVQYLDEKGRALRSVSTGFDGSAIYQDTQYDTRGREVAKSLPYFAGDEPYWAETFYDDLDRVVRKVAETSRQVHVASLAYDGLKTTETDSLGREKSTWTNAEGKVVAVQEEEGASVEYDYDPRGNLIRTVQGDDHSGKTAETTIAYDQRDRKIAMQDADLGRWTYGYNSFGESERQQDAVGNRTELVYDTLGRTVRRNDLPAGGTVQTTTWTFDSAPRGGGVWLGKLARIDGPAPGYRVQVSYDALGRELTASQQTDGKTFTVSNEYDSFGRVGATIQPGGFRIEHRYNAYGYLVEQRTPAQPSVDGYDPAFVRSLLAETAAGATKALTAATQYADQAAYFERKSAEYETVIRQLIQGQQLAPGTPDLGTAAVALLRDGTGTLYLRTHAGTASERLYLLTQASAGWSLQDLDSAAATKLLPYLQSTGESLYFGDFNADGTRDFIRVPNGSSDRPLPQCDSAAARQTNALAAGSPDLRADGALPILTDARGTEYFTAPQHSIIVHGAVATPVVTRRTGHYRLAFDTAAARWRLEPIDAEVWAAFTAGTLTDTGRRIAFGDFDNNGQADFRRLDRNGNPVQLAARTNPGCATIAEASPLIDRGVFDGLMQTAATIRSAARTLQREAETAVSLARDLILVAADLRDRARQSELWAAGSSASDLQALTAENGWIVLWRATARDASGRLTAERAGNGLITTRDYDPADGHLSAIQTGYQYGSLLRYLTYEYDAENNVVARHDELAATDESFDYDALDRLTASHLRGTLYSQPYSASIDYRYDALGNITHKSDIGDYVSGETGGPVDHAGPHAVHQVSGRGLYRYDANGNLLQGGGRTIAWSNDNLPVRLSKGAAAVEFAYGPDRNRYKKTVRSGGSLTETTWYVGKGYERTEKSGAVTHKYFVQGDDGVAAIYVRQESNGAIDPRRDQLRYLHRDALGSVDTITDGRGVAIERTGFQPFGARLGAGWTTSVAGVLPFTNRGFTGHEQIDEIGLIHMNGRVYDPELGRFLSADPFVQAPTSSQSYNRYSYVMNNPMKYTDPSGYFLKGLLKGIVNAFQSAFDFVKDNIRMIAAIGLAAITGGVSLMLGAGAVVAGAISGFVSSYVMTGSLSAALRGGVIGGISAGLAFGIGHGIDWAYHFHQFAEVAKTVAHGVAQGLVSEIQGGDFRSGFLGGMIGHVAGGQANSWFKGDGLGGIAGRTSVAAIAGGASAELGGGKFASGAMSATFAHLFNQEASVERIFEFRRAFTNTPWPTRGHSEGLAIDGLTGGVTVFRCGPASMTRGDRMAYGELMAKEGWYESLAAYEAARNPIGYQVIGSKMLTPTQLALEVNGLTSYVIALHRSYSVSWWNCNTCTRQFEKHFGFESPKSKQYWMPAGQPLWKFPPRSE